MIESQNNCVAITKSGKVCRNRKLDNEIYCRLHIYKKYETRFKRFRAYVQGSPLRIFGALFLALIGVVATIYFGHNAASHKDIETLDSHLSSIEQQVGVAVKNPNLLDSAYVKSTEELESALGMDMRDINDLILMKINTADGLFRDKEYKNAKAAYIDLIQDYPNSSPLHFNLANCYYYLDQYLEAYKELNICRQLTSGDAAVYCNLGLCLKKMGDTTTAIDLYRKSLAIDSAAVLTKNNIGITYMQIGRRDLAHEYLKQSVEDEPDVPTFRLNYGYVLHAEGKYREAKAQFEIAIDMDPGNYKAHCNLGVVHFKMGNIDSAIVEYRMALSIDPKDSFTHNNIAIAYKARGEYDSAVVHYQKAIQLRPRDPALRANLGYLYRKVGNFPAAERCFWSATALDSTDYVYFLFWGESLGFIGEHRKALVACSTASELNPKCAICRAYLASSALSLGDSARAYNEYKSAMKIDPKFRNFIMADKDSPLFLFLNSYKP